DKQDITKVEIIKDPTKMSYTEGDKPNHDGIKVKLTDKNGNTVEIGKDQLQEYGVTVTPTEATDLTVKDHNGHPFTASVTGKDGQPVTGNGKANITVVEKQQPAKPTVENPAAKNEKGKDSTTVTGTTTPHTEVVVTDKDGKEIGRGTSGDDGTFTIETNPKQDAGTEVTITPNGGVPAKATVTEDAPDQSATPTVNRPTEGDTTVTGRGVPDAVIVVTDKDGKVIGETTVGKDGNWTVDVPKDRPLKPGETITVTQTEKDKAPATTQTTVKGKDNGGNWFINLTPVTSEDAKRDTGIHKLYIYGYEDDTFKPEGNMTRAEAAAMLARLQGLDLSNTERPGFIDVRSGWYNASINAVVSAGYMKGYPDGTFRPDGKITRAEFAQMIKAIDKANTGVAPFADVKGHWAEVAIDQAYANGRIAGYPDGTFRPNNHITRAEAVTVFNKLYDRSVNEIGLADVRENLVEFKDVSRGHWAYSEIVESSNTHEFYRTEKGKVAETWTRVLQTWKAALANR
ncbi:MAG: S-layer homology domain-containing protein, partial [Peptoniphilus sp.]